MRFLVTAGNTRQPIDMVRDWGNVFTGNTGLSIAQALSNYGQVDLLTSNVQHIEALRAQTLAGGPIQATGFYTHADLKGSLAALMGRQTYDGVFMTAAVSDYNPIGAYAVLKREKIIAPDSPGKEYWTVENAQQGKIKSNHPLVAFLGEPTEKLVDLFRTDWQHRGLLFKFKLEVGLTDPELLKVASASRLSSGADYIVANTLAMVRGDHPGAYLIGQESTRWIEREKLASELANLAAGK